MALTGALTDESWETLISLPITLVKIFTQVGVRVMPPPTVMSVA